MSTLKNSESFQEPELFKVAEGIHLGGNKAGYLTYPQGLSLLLHGSQVTDGECI